VANKDTSEVAGEMYIPNYTMLDFGFPTGEETSYKASPNGAEEMHIPNHIMLDFGFSEGTSVGRNLHSQ
jgi:hypothetical protein